MTEVLTAKEAAGVLRLHVRQVYDLLGAGKIAGARTSDGRNARWRIPRQAVDEFLGVRARASGQARALRAEDI